MNWTTIAMWSPLVLLAYQLVIDWVPLFPWNDITKKTTRERILETAINYSPLLLIAFAFSQPKGIGWTVAALGSMIYLLGHLNAWWRPYFFGADEQALAEYQRLFGRTYKFLPAIDDHPIPDAEHVVIGLLTLCMVVSVCVALFTTP